MDKTVPRIPVMRGEQTAIEWMAFFRSLVRTSKDAPVAQTVGSSPASITAPADGILYIVGGTVSQVQITRTGWTLTCGPNANPVPVRTGDVITITYTSAPAVQFLAD